MKHRGEIFKKALEESGVKVIHLAKAIKVDKKTIYNWYSTPNIPLEKLVEIGKVLNYDFSQDVPEMAKHLVSKTDLGINYQTKYIDLLEDHNSLLKTHAQLLATIAQERDSKNQYDEKMVNAINRLAELTESKKKREEAISLN